MYVGPKIVTDGLICYLDFANAKSYSTSSNNIYDLSAYSNNGTTYNEVQFNSDNYGALNFDFGNEQLNITNNSFLSASLSTNNFTLITIVRSDDVVYPRSRHPMYINQNPYTASAAGFSVGHQASSSTLEFRICDGVNLYSSTLSHTVLQSTIYHRAFVIDRNNGANIKYYVNSGYIGEVTATSVTGSIYTNGGIRFGDVWGWKYIGNIYQVMLYNKALTPNEILQNFNAHKSRFNL